MRLYTSSLSEDIIIGALINDVSLLLELKDLKVGYFSNKLDKMLYTVINILYKGGAESISIADIFAFVSSNADYNKMLEQNDGIEYLDKLQELGEDYTYDDLKPHVNNVIKCAFKDRLRDVLLYVQTTLDTEKEMTVKELYDTLEGQLMDVRSDFTAGNKIVKLGDRMDKIRKKLDRYTTTEFSGFPTGYQTLDKFFTYEVGELVIYSAPAKFGKSQWVVDMIYNLSVVNKIPMLVVDTELTDETFTSRLAAKIMNVNFNFIKKGHYKKYEWAVKKYNETLDMISECPIYHQYTAGWSQNDVYNEIKRLKKQANLKMVVWDYLKVENVSEKKKENTELANLTNFLKNQVAGELELAVVAMAQTSDYSKAEGGLRIWGSNQIKQYASTICYFVKKSKEQIADDLGIDVGGNMYIFVKENRNGVNMEDESKGINFKFDKSKAVFEEAIDNQYALGLLEDESYEEDEDDV